MMKSLTPVRSMMEERESMDGAAALDGDRVGTVAVCEERASEATRAMRLSARHVSA